MGHHGKGGYLFMKSIRPNRAFKAERTSEDILHAGQNEAFSGQLLFVLMFPSG